MLAVALTACGGGGGGTSSSTNTPTNPPQGPAEVPTVSGVAATGAAMTGTVSLKDSIGNNVDLGPDQLGANGNFSFNVTGLTAPFYIQACDAQNNCLYSVSMSSGTGNVNPLTNLAVALAADVPDPAVVYSNPSLYNSLIQDYFNLAVAYIQSLFQSIFEQYGANPDFLTDDTFEANHQGLDGVFDHMNMNISGGVLSFNVNCVEFTDDYYDETDDFDETSIAAALLTECLVFGSGMNCPLDADTGGQNCSFPATLSLNVDSTSLGSSSLSYDFQTTIFQATSITSLTVVNGTATITGIGDLNEDPGHAFTATVVEGELDEMMMEIEGVTSPFEGTLPLIDGGYTLQEGNPE